VAEKVRMQFDTMVGETKKSAQNVITPGVKPK
jgi:hypothetical protein